MVSFEVRKYLKALMKLTYLRKFPNADKSNKIMMKRKNLITAFCISMF